MNTTFLKTQSVERYIYTHWVWVGFDTLWLGWLLVVVKKKGTLVDTNTVTVTAAAIKLHNIIIQLIFYCSVCDPSPSASVSTCYTADGSYRNIQKNSKKKKRQKMICLVWAWICYLLLSELWPRLKCSQRTPGRPSPASMSRPWKLSST